MRQKMCFSFFRVIYFGDRLKVMMSGNFGIGIGMGMDAGSGIGDDGLIWDALVT
jgi:hypothetical protein